MACKDIDCLKTFGCAEKIKRTFNSAILSPFVEVGFIGDRDVITVGNNSNPSSGNRAVIKSFQYGHSNGTGVTIEIYDEQGGNFEKFMEKLNKSLIRAGDKYKLRVNFGWIGLDCNGVTTKISVTDKKEAKDGLFFLPQKIDSVYEGGKIKFTLTGIDLIQLSEQTNEAKTQGKESSKKDIKQAIRDHFKNAKPPITNISFKRINEEGEFNFKADGTTDFKGVWPSNTKLAISAVREWANKMTTDRDKGVIFIWNPATPFGKDEPKDFGELVFVEDPLLGPNEAGEGPCGNRNIGTYIVNGGNCTSVISFNPTAQWTLAYNEGKGGQSGGGASGETTKQTGDENSKKEKEGLKSLFPVSWYDFFLTAPSRILQAIKKSFNANSKATKMLEGIIAPIEAELKIQGDPYLSAPLLTLFRNVSIIVINPFHIRKENNDCIWLAKPICNPVYTNKDWMIFGVEHQIQGGSYVTTLKLKLPTPGIHIEPDVGLGGSGKKFDGIGAADKGIGDLGAPLQ